LFVLALQIADWLVEIVPAQQAHARSKMTRKRLTPFEKSPQAEACGDFGKAGCFWPGVLRQPTPGLHRSWHAVRRGHILTPTAGFAP
jgi:hypothetical protein